jgi:hypothetical protein
MQPPYIDRQQKGYRIRHGRNASLNDILAEQGDEFPEPEADFNGAHATVGAAGALPNPKPTEPPEGTVGEIDRKV